MVARARKIAEAQWFDLLTVTVIIANAIVLGLETYDGIEREHGSTLHLLNDVFLGYYVVELAIRITAYAPRFGSFFKDGWNLFDFVVVAASFTPGLRENTTLLRIVRLLRVTRLVRLLKDLRVVVAAIGHAVPGVASLAMASVMLIYVYAMIGWVLFGGQDERFADLGEAMLTMFQVLTLENLPDFLADGRAITAWAVPFYVTYALLASFIVFNLFIGIVLNSMEEARAAELRRAESELLDDDESNDVSAASHAVRERIHRIREDLDAIDSDLDALRRALDRKPS